MSEQTKSNVQMAGAGFMGFVAVVGAAGLLLTQLSGRRAEAPVASAPAAVSAPASPSLPMTASRPVSEARQNSPAPIIGSVADDVVDEAAAAAAAAGASEAAAYGETSAGAAGRAALGAMGAPRFAGKGDSVSTASSEVRRFAAAPDAAPPAPDHKPVPRIALDKSAARGSIASSVHYGVTSRAELMGRAAGPVYNFTGRSVAGRPRFAELSGDANGKITDVEKSIDASDLSPEQKREMKARLQNVRDGVGK